MIKLLHNWFYTYHRTRCSPRHFFVKWGDTVEGNYKAAQDRQRNYVSDAINLKNLLSVLAQRLLEESERKQTELCAAPQVSAFLEKNGWILVERPREAVVSLKKQLLRSAISVDAHILPRSLSATMPRHQTNAQVAHSKPTNTVHPVTDFSVTYEVQGSSGSDDPAGIIFCCTMFHQGYQPRFVIGNIGCYLCLAEKHNPFSYHGPDFDDLADTLQQALKIWLDTLGIDDAFCNILEALVTDKRRQETTRLLKTLGQLVDTTLPALPSCDNSATST